MNQVLTRVSPRLVSPTLHSPVDVVGHRHEHQRPTNAREDHHGALVQHFGCWFFHQFQARNDREREEPPHSAEDHHRLAGLPGMIIHTDYDDDDDDSNMQTNSLRTV